MQQRLKSKKDRGQRHSAAWGKRLSMLLLLLIAETAFAEHGNNPRAAAGKFATAPSLAAAEVECMQAPHIPARFKERPTMQIHAMHVTPAAYEMRPLGRNSRPRVSNLVGRAM